MNPKVNCRLWMKMCQCRFILSKKCTPLVSVMVIMEDVMYVLGQRYMGNLYLPFYFIVNLKVL